MSIDDMRTNPRLKRIAQERTRRAVALAFREDLAHRRKLLTRLKACDMDVVERAVECFNSYAAAAAWLTRPQSVLSGNIPAEMKMSSGTKKEVLNILDRIEYGVF